MRLVQFRRKLTDVKHKLIVYARFTRMSPERFEDLLTLVGPFTAKKPCRSRNSISEAERLMVTLRYLATGDSQQSHSFLFHIGKSTISNLLRETCEAIWHALKEKYLNVPSTTSDWRRIAKEFEDEWNFPNCIGAIDGKHIMMDCPKNGGSAYYNYKSFHSIVLLAICDAKYCFTFADIGGFGSTNDASVLSNSVFGQAFEQHPTDLNLPSPSPHGDKDLPFVIVGDDIFPLKPWLMKPYLGKNLDQCQRIYNYRLSRARRTIENAFGILVAKWRIFRRAIREDVALVEKIVQATICLHNYLCLTENANYTPAGFVDSEDSSGNIIPGDWRSEVSGDEGGLRHLNQSGGNRYTFEAGRARDDFKSYFNSPEGEVPWQLQHVLSCGRTRN